MAEISIISSLRRIAAAFGSAPRGSQEERLLRELLFAKLGACCDEADGPCAACPNMHGHTCERCGEDYCRDCYEDSELHQSTCTIRDGLEPGAVEQFVDPFPVFMAYAIPYAEVVTLPLDYVGFNHVVGERVIDSWDREHPQPTRALCGKRRGTIR